MATIFTESFDIYASSADMVAASGGPWSLNQGSFVSGTSTQFNSGLAYQPNSNNTAPFATGTNETTIYGSLRFKPNSTGSSTNYGAITLLDGATAQCTIRMNTDGSVALYTGSPTGTLIQSYSSTYNGAVWNSMQFKIVIDNTAGSIEVRFNGSPSSVITKTSCNTRGGTTNAYVNAVMWTNSGTNVLVDDLYLNNTTGNNPISWPGDVRAVQMTPVQATSTFTAVNPANVQQNIQTGWANTATRTAGQVIYWPFTATVTAKIMQGWFNTQGTVTPPVNCKVAIYDGSTGVPGTALGVSDAFVNPGSSSTIFLNFSTPVQIYNGKSYFMAFNQDASLPYQVSPGTTSTVLLGSTSYASFPVSNPTGLTANNAGPDSGYFTNVGPIGQFQQDGDTSYITANTVTQDTYTLWPALSNAVVAMQYYVMWRKTDAGSRTVTLSTNANSSGDTALITQTGLVSSYVYQFATFEKDPTGAYWTAVTANSQILGLAITV